MNEDKLVELIKKLEIQGGLLDLKLAQLNAVNAELQAIRCRLAEIEGFAEMDEFINNGRNHES